MSNNEDKLNFDKNQPKDASTTPMGAVNSEPGDVTPVAGYGTATAQPGYPETPPATAGYDAPVGAYASNPAGYDVPAGNNHEAYQSVPPVGYHNSGQEAGNAPGYNAPYNQGQQQSAYGIPQGHGGPHGSGGSNDFTANWKRPDNLALIYGASSLVLLGLSAVFFLFGILGLVAAILGVLEANKAKKQGLDATIGKILSWVSLGLYILAGVIIGGFLLIWIGLFAFMA